MDKEYYYGVTRTNDYLAHYGVRGMKWGVRKAIQSGNTKALGRQYQKAQKKLAKLEARANNGKKYAKRAAALGAGAAAAGGLAAAGTSGVSSAMAKIGAHGGRAMVGAGRGLSRAGSALSSALYRTGNSKLRKIGARGGQAMISAGNAINKAGAGVSSGMYGASKAVRNWGNSNSIGKAAGGIASKNSQAYLRAARRNGGGPLGNISNNTIARAGAAAIGAGLAGGAAYNAYRAATTKRAARKAAEFRKEMNQAFAGTQYGRSRRKRRR